VTKADILAEVREIRPNEYQDAWVLKQVEELHQRVLRELAANYIIPAEGGELQTPSPYHKVYVYWALAQIDLANAEYDRYNNDLALFNAAWQELANYISRTFEKPPQRGFRI
jgi:hypothetical protein